MQTLSMAHESLHFLSGGNEIEGVLVKVKHYVAMTMTMTPWSFSRGQWSEI